jgi:hypothetical protein
MTKISKLAGMFYEINGNHIEIDVVETFPEQPTLHISKQIYTNNSNFWDFVLDATVEAKQQYIDIIANVDGHSTEDGIKNAKVNVEKLSVIEKALTSMVSTTNK